ncbi:alpha/beta hydrolase [Streptomyces mirabilis]|uniref:alpha/beta hydrolase n=1 Tax=Streptomyces mirabilis TaxID=68239 RepID=UPI00367F7560
MSATHRPAPAVDPALQGVLDDLHVNLSPTVRPEDLDAVRAGGLTPPLQDILRNRSVRSEDRRIPGPDGAPDVLLSILRSDRQTPPGPGIVFFHVSGNIFGDRFTGIAPIVDYVEQLGAVVVTVEYRLAPEHPAPAALDDAYAALTWTSKHAGELGFDPAKLLVAGISAGGGLAAAVTLRARDEGLPVIAGSLLLSAGLDERNDTTSSHQIDGIALWDRTSNDTGWDLLLGDRRGTDDVPAHVSPSRTADVGGLPPTYIDVGSVDTFRDEDVAYASAIWAAGGDAELHVWPGGYHLFELLAPHAPVSIRAREARLAWIRQLLSR